MSMAVIRLLKKESCIEMSLKCCNVDTQSFCVVVSEGHKQKNEQVFVIMSD